MFRERHGRVVESFTWRDCDPAFLKDLLAETIGVAGGSLHDLIKIYTTPGAKFNQDAEIAYAEYLDDCHYFFRFAEFVKEVERGKKEQIFSQQVIGWCDSLYGSRPKPKQYQVSSIPFQSVLFPVKHRVSVRHSRLPYVKVIFGHSFPIAIRCLYGDWTLACRSFAQFFPWIKRVPVGTIPESHEDRILPGEFEIVQQFRNR